MTTTDLKDVPLERLSADLIRMKKLLGVSHVLVQELVEEIKRRNELLK